MSKSKSSFGKGGRQGDGPADLQKLGNKAILGGDIKASVRLYREALKAEPDRPELHAFLGAMLIPMDDFEAAAFHLKEAIRLGATTPQTYHNLAITLGNMGVIGEALKFAKMAIEKGRGTHTLAQHLVADIEDGTYTGGPVLCMEGAGKDERCYQYAMLAHQRGENARAIELLERSAKLAPEEPTAFYQLGMLYMDAGDLDKAIHHFQKVVQMGAGDIFVYRNLGLAFARGGRFKEALEQLNTALKFARSDSDVAKMRTLIAHIKSMR